MLQSKLFQRTDSSKGRRKKKGEDAEESAWKFRRGDAKRDFKSKEEGTEELAIAVNKRSSSASSKGANGCLSAKGDWLRTLQMLEELCFGSGRRSLQQGKRERVQVAE